MAFCFASSNSLDPEHVSVIADPMSSVSADNVSHAATSSSYYSSTSPRYRCSLSGPSASGAYPQPQLHVLCSTASIELLKSSVILSAPSVSAG